MNIYALAVAVCLWLASLTGVGYWQYGAGKDAQKAADQSRFATYDSAIATQKAQANLEYRNAQDANVQLMAERDQLRNTLEKARAQNQTATDDLRRRLAGERLRFAAALPREPRPGTDSGSAPASGVDAARADAPAVVELPATLTSDLRQLALDADRLRDEYRLCFDAIHKVK